MVLYINIIKCMLYIAWSNIPKEDERYTITFYKAKCNATNWKLGFNNFLMNFYTSGDGFIY
jgi:hypothetical protein